MKAILTVSLVLLVVASQLAMATEVVSSSGTAEVSTESIDTAPATLFFFSQVATPPSDEPEVLEFGDSVAPISGASTGLPAANTAVSPY